MNLSWLIYKNDRDQIENNDAEIEQILNTNYVDLAIISSYFDLNDFSTPVHHYLQDTNLIGLNPSLCYISVYNVKYNQIFLNDDIVLGGQGTTKEYSYYSLDRFSTLMANFKQQNNNYFQIYITLDRQANQYFRSVYR